uniref:ATP-binding protein n=1 Tax=Brevundimonas aurantiaca TaxID=74316 RepID=UPI002FDEBE12
VPTAVSGWTVASRFRAKQVLQRVGTAAATALVVTPMLGWGLSLLWFLIYGLAQGVEWAILRRASRAPDAPFWRLVSYAAILISATTFGCLSIPMWLIGGPMGGLCSALMLPAQVLFSMMNAPRSKTLLVVTLSPPILYLLSTPIFAARFGADISVMMTASAAVVLFAIFAVLGWQIISETAEKTQFARDEAERLRRQAEQNLAAHTAFLAAIGHDLRTPIGAILTGAAELQAADATSRANTALITDAGLMMKALLDDLLDHTRIGAGRMKVEVVDFDLRAMLAQTLRLWRGPIEAKGLTLRVEGAAQMPRDVKGDSMRIRQVLNNLMSNAVKFTAEGQITLRLEAWPEEPSGYALLFEVADTGPGLTAEQMERLFNPFDQTAEGVGAQFGGSGLGLSISRDLTELMGGRLTARSAPGQGARFTVSLFLPAGRATERTAPAARGLTARPDALALPLAAPPIAPPAEDVPAPAAETPPVETPAAPPPSEEADRPLKLLVVDDHDINRRAVQLILEPLGCDIVTASDGVIALQRCAEVVFDVIFMDVRMPELDGRETTRRLRAGDGPNARTPVVAVTADSAPEDIAACQAAGMAYFVSKPLTPPALFAALQHVLDDAAQDAGAATPQPSTSDVDAA